VAVAGLFGASEIALLLATSVAAAAGLMAARSRWLGPAAAAAAAGLAVAVGLAVHHFRARRAVIYYQSESERLGRFVTALRAGILGRAAARRVVVCLSVAVALPLACSSSSAGPIDITFWLRNGHLASVFGSLLRQPAGIQYRRELFSLVRWRWLRSLPSRPASRHHSGRVTLPS
jgi:hypothetical protein